MTVGGAPSETTVAFPTVDNQGVRNKGPPLQLVFDSPPTRSDVEEHFLATQTPPSKANELGETPGCSALRLDTPVYDSERLTPAVPDTAGGAADSCANHDVREASQSACWQITQDTHSTTAGCSTQPTETQSFEADGSAVCGTFPKETQFYSRLSALVSALSEAHEQDLACSQPREDPTASQVAELRAANAVLRAEVSVMQERLHAAPSSTRPSVLGRLSKHSSQPDDPPPAATRGSNRRSPRGDRLPVPQGGAGDRNHERSDSRCTSALSMTKRFEARFVWRPNPAQTQAARKFSLSRSRSFAVLAQGQAQVEEIVTGFSRLQPYVLHPGSSRRLVWDLMSMALLAYDILVIPFASAFNPESNLFSEAMTWFTLFFWTFDVGASLLTGFTNGRETVLRPSDIALNYLKTWFLMDMIIIGMDWALVLLSGDGGQSAARLGRSLRTLRFIRTLRLIRVLKMKRIVQEIQDHINTEAVSICFGISKIVLCLILANHIVACVWYAIGLIGTDDHATWVTMNSMTGRSMAYRYATSLHWSLTQFTPASMEIVPENINERVFSVIVLVFAMVTFSSFVSILTASIAQLRNIRNDETRQFWLLRRYLRDCGASRRTGLRVQRYLEYAYHQQSQRVQEKEVGLLGLLSEPLREELKHETLSQHLSKHPLFPTCDDRTRVFSKALGALSLARGDLVFTSGDHASRMIFLSAGGMEYSSDDGSNSTIAHGPPADTSPTANPSNPSSPLYSSTPVSFGGSESEVLVPGQWVCEPVLWTQWIHLGDLFALMECQIVVIDADQFFKSVQVNTPLLMEMRKYARAFIDALNMLDREDLTDLLHLQFSAQEILDLCEFTRSINPEGEDDVHEGFAPFSKMRRSIKVTTSGWRRRSVQKIRTSFGGKTPVVPELSCIEAYPSGGGAWGSDKGYK